MLWISELKALGHHPCHTRVLSLSLEENLNQHSVFPLNVPTVEVPLTQNDLHMQCYCNGGDDDDDDDNDNGDDERGGQTLSA